MPVALLHRVLLVSVLASAGAFTTGAAAAQAQQQGLPVDLELILAIDCSGSASEW